MSELEHIIVDTETLGIKPDSVVLSIGATAFSLVPNGSNDFQKYIQHGFYAKLNIRDQITTYGRKINEDTVAWWKSQSVEAQNVLRPSADDMLMSDALNALNAWIKRVQGYKWKDSYVWCRGNYFDFPILESMYDQAGIKCGYNTWKIRDVRTYIDILTGDTWGKYEPRNGTPREFIAHDALHDAAMDAYRMVEIFNDAAGEQ